MFSSVLRSPIKSARHYVSVIGIARSYGRRSPLHEITRIIGFTFYRSPIAHWSVRYRRLMGTGPRQGSVPNGPMCYREVLKLPCYFASFACARTDLFSNKNIRPLSRGLLVSQQHAYNLAIGHADAAHIKNGSVSLLILVNIILHYGHRLPLRN